MQRKKLRGWIVLAVILVLFNVFVFLIPVPKTGVFWVSYLFTLVAIFAQIYVFFVAFHEGETVLSKMYGFPIAKVGVMYLVSQLILGIVCIVFGRWIPIWVALILFVFLLGAALIGFVATDFTRDEIVRQEISHREEVSTMRKLKAKTEAMAEQYPQNKALRDFAEKMRYSDPVSSAALSDVEQRLTEAIYAISHALSAGEDASRLCQQAERILTERNHLCRVSKH